ncbi:hypothetical protein LT330_004647 [Penicillium expansum]|uniref:Uncharacterized protein n=1 Tax=Penicillium expansum TaxID=27334 RepID=A0A0A2K2S9_PENEN|nr:hypothetical protein PEX2_014590 [Penicillium expansum]KAK4860916.1 hypothetical protein LT330_004647 [Penicillium expansum]KGO41164.1 hypothetical protein PEXP_085270 [Penicillium expansum]KGO58710.1 hypothetical protein PEX1_101620 [Penicillium expansum]KGO61963.1 hypothetical protein PEX2_014590 [Penicillium expansum]
MGVKMAKCEPPPVLSFSASISHCSSTTLSIPTTPSPSEPIFLPYWARYPTKCAQNLLDYSDEPIEYDHDDEDYRDNCFFFPEDCSWTPPKNCIAEVDCVALQEEPEIQEEEHTPSVGQDTDTDTDTMIPGLPDIKMLDAEALSDLLEDNLSPPEITTIIVFATNGAVFAHGSSLSSRQLRNLSATYGAAYTCYAKTASTGNLTGVNPASHPSSYITAKSMSLGDVGSIVFELDESVAVVTRIADKVLVAAVGPSSLDAPEPNGATNADSLATDASALDATNGTSTPDGAQGDISRTLAAVPAPPNPPHNGHRDPQFEIDRSADLERLASLNLSASPAVLLALESKCAALGRFLGEKLDDLESPEDF